MNIKRHLLRTTILNYLKTIIWSSPVALTLTLKQKFQNHKIDIIETSKNIKHFLNRLNRLLYGNAYKRFSNAVKIFPVIEYDVDKRFHVHAIIDKPDTIDEIKFYKAIKQSWSKTKFGYDHIHIQTITSDGWISYLTKFAQKPDYDLSIDWMNVTK